MPPRRTTSEQLRAGPRHLPKFRYRGMAAILILPEAALPVDHAARHPRTRADGWTEAGRRRGAVALRRGHAAGSRAERHHPLAARAPGPFGIDPARPLR